MPAQPSFLSLAIKSSDSPREGGSHKGGNLSIGCCQSFQHCKAKEFQSPNCHTYDHLRKKAHVDFSQTLRQDALCNSHERGNSPAQQMGATIITVTSTVTAVVAAVSQRCCGHGREAELPPPVPPRATWQPSCSPETRDWPWERGQLWPPVLDPVPEFPVSQLITKPSRPWWSDAAKPALFWPLSGF